MARGGIYKSEVLRARERLLAQGRYPSIDAVRAELGDTGSKTTIHRYLKEIEEEQGSPAGSQVAVSEALQELVGRLAAQLQHEADARVQAQAQAHEAASAQLQQQHAQALQEAQAQAQHWQTQGQELAGLVGELVTRVVRGRQDQRYGVGGLGDHLDHGQLV